MFSILKNKFKKLDDKEQLPLPLVVNEINKFQFVPPGHYYSAIPDIDEIIKNFDKIVSPERFKDPDLLYGIDLNINYQIGLLNTFEKYYLELPFTDEKSSGLRYFYQNPAYSYSDAIFLFCMIRFLNPKNIIEIGSGYSSCVMLDTNELFFNNSINCEFIEPYPDLLKSLFKPGDIDANILHPTKLQDIPLEQFKKLDKNDILFIDSTHVSKINSDVNYIIHEILPNLNDGVHIHFHDIFYPFEYPKEWIMEGRSWNEMYILRAFLEFNYKFKIIFFNTFLSSVYKEEMERFPLTSRNTGGSIWIKKQFNCLSGELNE